MLMAVFVLVLGATQCSRQAQHAQQKSIQKVTIGIQVSPAMTLVMVAKDEGFFLQQGLDVELKEFTAGKFALQAFLGGSIDFAVSGEVPVCLAALQGNQIRVVAQVVDKTVNEVRVVALKDQGKNTWKNPAEYFTSKKRKIATSFGGGPEFYTYNFLKHYHINPSQIEILSQRPEDMPAALAAHSVDAISIFDPFAYIAENKLGNEAVTFREADLYSELYVLDARPEQLEKDHDVIVALLRALRQAEQFIAANPEKSKQIMQKYTKLDRKVIDGIWGSYSFKVALNQRLLKYLADEAVWARDTGKVEADTNIPDFSRFIASRFLKEVDPGAVKF